MKNNLFTVLTFATGAAIGVAATWYFAKTKYEQIAQEEIDSVKEVFHKREQEFKKEKNTEEKPKYASVRKSEDMIKKAKDILKNNGYVRVNHEVKKDAPYVIPPEEFMNNEDYENISLTYYSDGVLADENDDVVEDVENVVGRESLNHFGEYEDDSVFVRNDILKCDYEILYDLRNYSEVIKHIPHNPLEE